ncbi:MAG: hypothetical protein K8U57_19810 [Planctomycetes bacterium]|nr:hypothetical protein [Planctomycetota bacterium]
MGAPHHNVNRDDSKAFWERIQQRIFDQVPPHDIYEDIGVRDISASPDSGGWHQCRGFGRADRNKSAQFHSESGYWMDFADPEAEGTIWEVVAKHGGFSDWEAARDHYAGRAGVDIPKPGNGAWKKHKSPPRESRPRKKAVEKETLHENLLGLALACHEQAKASGILDRYCEKEGFSRFAADAMLVGFMDRKKPIFQSRSIAACDYMTLPEVQADRTIETLLRCPWNKGFDKLGLAGRPRGIYTPRGWTRRAAKTGYVVIPEGGSDTLAATTMGLGAIGYHGARTGDGAAILAAHIRQRLDDGSLPSDIKIVLTQDNDAGAGASGTAQVGQHLADALGRPIHRRRMPVVGWSVGYAEIPWDIGHIPKDV